MIIFTFILMVWLNLVSAQTSGTPCERMKNCPCKREHSVKLIDGKRAGDRRIGHQIRS